MSKERRDTLVLLVLSDLLVNLVRKVTGGFLDLLDRLVPKETMELLVLLVHSVPSVLPVFLVLLVLKGLKAQRVKLVQREKLVHLDSLVLLVPPEMSSTRSPSRAP